jgi:ABC-type transporter Mla subunit MlaD
MANTVQNAKDAASHAADKAKDVASSAMDKTREVASSVADKSRDMASRVGQKADDMAGRAGSALESAAGTVREHAPQSGVFGSAASKVADTLESGGRYLREEGVTGLAEDLTDMIRRNPIPAMLLGLGVGFLLARALSGGSNS